LHEQTQRLTCTQTDATWLLKTIPKCRVIVNSTMQVHMLHRPRYDL